MPSTIIDSAIFQGIFSSDEMRHVWSDENRTQKYLDIERALAKVQGRLGLIPQEAADEIVSHCRLDQIDMAKLRQQTERIGYPILGVVSQLNALCRDKLGEYCHWGATTQDITDTATVLQIREALAIVDRELTAISAAHGAPREDAPRHADDRPQQPAAGDSGDLRLQDGRPAVGDRAPSRAPRAAEGARAGRRVRRRGRHAGVAGERRDGNAGRPVRRAGAEAAGDRLAHDPRQHRRGRRLPRPRRRHARQAQHGREADDADRGRRGLRAVRARPRLAAARCRRSATRSRSCYIHAAISVVRQHAAALMDAMVADHERSTGPWEIEWIVLPEAFCLMAGALKQSRFVLEGLEVDAQAMRRNIDLTHGLVMSEAVMMGLGPYIGREYAHDLVYDICREALEAAAPAARPAGRASGDQASTSTAPRSRSCAIRPTTSASPA